MASLYPLLSPLRLNLLCCRPQPLRWNDGERQAAAKSWIERCQNDTRDPDELPVVSQGRSFANG